MREKTGTFTRKKALFIVFICAAVLLALITLRYQGKGTDISTPEKRELFLAELEWEINADSFSERSIVIPKDFDGIISSYNKLQLAQGWDLQPYAGKTCTQYTYELTNYPNYDRTVYVTLYAYKGRMIGGDIHTADINGFMHGLKFE